MNNTSENMPFLKSVRATGDIFGFSYNKMKCLVNERDNNGLNEHIFKFNDAHNGKIYIDINGFANWLLDKKLIKTKNAEESYAKEKKTESKKGNIGPFS